MPGVTRPGGQHQYACPSCGAALEFAPGTAGLACPYCGARLEHRRARGGQPQARLRRLRRPRCTPRWRSCRAFAPTCRSCGSTQQTTALAGRCPSCRGTARGQRRPGRPAQGARRGGAVRGRPRAGGGGLPRLDVLAVVRPLGPEEGRRRPSRCAATYLPHWGFDDRTATDYTGQRGDHYYTTETYTTQENGRDRDPHPGGAAHPLVARLRPGRARLRRRARGRGGDAGRRDLLGEAGAVVDRCAPSGYQPELLAGFDAPRYDVDAAEGFAAAKREMAE